MSLLLSDKVWVMLSEVAKRGIYPTHSAKLGIYRLPVDIVGQSEVNGIMSELKPHGYVLDTYADRIFVTFKWIEKGFDIYTNSEQSAELNVTVEIVIGEVLDIIYQIKPLETFGDFYWIRNYRQKADHNAKIIIDNIIRNTKIGQKLITYYQKIQKLSQAESIKKLESITPLANALKNLYVSTGIGYIVSHMTYINRNSILLPGYSTDGLDNSNQLFIPARIGYEFKVFNKYDQPSFKIDIGYQYNFVLGDNLDGFTAGASKDAFSQITLGFKFALGGMTSYRKQISY